MVLAIALGNSFLWSTYLLFTRHVVSGAHLDAWAYTLVQLLSAGLAMLWVGRRTPGSWRDLLAPWTISYAFMRVIINGATSAAIVWLAVTQSTLISTVSVLIGAAAGWALTRQAPARRDWPGLLLLAAGIASFVLALASDTAWRGVLWLILSETVAVAASWMIAYHPRNREADPAARSRFTGEILVARLAGADLRLVAGRTPGRQRLTLGRRWRCLRARRALGLRHHRRRGVPRPWNLARFLDHQPLRRADLPDCADGHAFLRHRAGGGGRPARMAIAPNLSKGEWLSAAVILGGAVWLIAARLRTPTS